MRGYADDRDEWREPVDRRRVDVRVGGVDVWRDGHFADHDRAAGRGRWRGHWHRHGFPWPFLVLGLFVFGGSGLFAALLFASVLAIMAVAVTVVAVNLLAPGVGEAVRSALPYGGRRRQPAFAPAPVQPASLAGRYAAGQLTQNEFRRQLIDVLKQRYVRGELTTAEYEDHLTRILRDPLA